VATPKIATRSRFSTQHSSAEETETFEYSEQRLDVFPILICRIAYAISRISGRGDCAEPMAYRFKIE
jgi:hypothetical protein